MVENTTHGSIYDSDTTNYMVNLLIPNKASVAKPDLAFGVFLGYTLSLGYTETNNNKYRIAVKEQMKRDISALAYIEQKIFDNGMSSIIFIFTLCPLMMLH